MGGILSSCQRFALLQPWSKDVECDLVVERDDDFSVVHFVTAVIPIVTDSP